MTIPLQGDWDLCCLRASQVPFAFIKHFQFLEIFFKLHFKTEANSSLLYPLTSGTNNLHKKPLQITQQFKHSIWLLKDIVRMQASIEQLNLQRIVKDVCFWIFSTSKLPSTQQFSWNYPKPILSCHNVSPTYPC